MKKNINEIVKETGEYITSMNEGGFEENDYTFDDVPFLFTRLVEEGILPKGPYIQITTDGNDYYNLDKTKFIIFNERDEFVVYFKESEILDETVDGDGFVNLNKDGFKILAEAYLKALLNDEKE